MIKPQYNSTWPSTVTQSSRLRQHLKSKALTALLKICIVIITLLFADNLAQAQNHKPFLKMGLEGGIGIFKPDDINDLIDSWLHAQAANVEIRGNTKFRLGLNLSSYAGFTFVKFLEIRPEIDYLYAPIIFDSSMGDGLNIVITSLSPGISANLRLGVLQFGGGLFRYFAVIEWKDNVLNFSDTWKGNHYGYHINVGLNLPLTSNFGFSGSGFFKKIKIEELKNGNAQFLRLAPQNRNFALDLSGLEFRMGLYLFF